MARMKNAFALSARSMIPPSFERALIMGLIGACRRAVMV